LQPEELKPWIINFASPRLGKCIWNRIKDAWSCTNYGFPESSGAYLFFLGKV